MTDREEFEAWARPLHYILDPDAFSGDCSFYHSPETRTAWAIWQAARAQPAQEPDLWKTQFLTDVMTSAGLIMHGRTDKKLAQRIADGSARWRTEIYTHPQPKREPLSDEQIAKATAVWFDGEFSGKEMSARMRAAIEAAITKGGV